MDTRLAVISLLFSLKVMSIQGQGCLRVTERWTNSSQTSVELQCFINGQRKFWRGTDPCDPHSFSVYSCSLTLSRTCIVPRSDYDNEPVSIFCCSSGDDLTSGDILCFQIMMCPNATINVPSVVVAGDQEKVYIYHIAKPPTPPQQPTLSVTLQGPNLTHLTNNALDVTTRTHSPTPLETTFIFSFHVPSFLPESTTIRFEPGVAKGESGFCTTPNVHSVSEIQVLVGEGGGAESTQPTEIIPRNSTTQSLPSTDTSCTCPAGLDKPGVFAAIAISLVLFGILLGTLTSCGVVVACFYKRKKMKETSSSSENGTATHNGNTPTSRPHPPTLSLKLGTPTTPTERDNLISNASSIPADTPNLLISNGHLQLNSFGGAIEVEGAPRPQNLSQGRTPTTPLSHRTLPLPSPSHGVQQSPPVHDGSEVQQKTPHYETILQCHRRVEVFGERNKDSDYGRQGENLRLGLGRNDNSGTSTFV